MVYPAGRAAPPGTCGLRRSGTTEATPTGQLRSNVSTAGQSWAHGRGRPGQPRRTSSRASLASSHARPLGDLGPSEPQRPESIQSGVEVAFQVAVTLAGRVVEEPAVQLDHQSVVVLMVAKTTPRLHERPRRGGGTSTSPWAHARRPWHRRAQHAAASRAEVAQEAVRRHARGRAPRVRAPRRRSGSSDHAADAPCEHPDRVHRSPSPPSSVRATTCDDGVVGAGGAAVQASAPRAAERAGEVTTRGR